jgi:hypothetical protein
MPVVGTLTVTVLDMTKRVLPRACRKAGLDRTIQWHVLRHTFASHLVMRGEPRKVVQELVGHANIESPMVTMWSPAIGECANHKQSLFSNSGGGGNRKDPISRRFRQLQVTTGNRALSQRKQKTRKNTFGKTLCQLAKSNTRRCREGRMWEICPLPRPWALARAVSCRALGTQSHESWREPSCGYSHLGKSNRDRPRVIQRS